MTNFYKPISSPFNSKLSPTSQWWSPDLDRCSLWVETITDLDLVQVTTGQQQHTHLAPHSSCVACSTNKTSHNPDKKKMTWQRVNTLKYFIKFRQNQPPLM